jgi:hypothetical protein
MNFMELPPALNNVIGTEGRDFVVKAGSLKPFRKSLPGIIAGIVWMAFFSLLFFGIFNVDLPEMIASGANENSSINPAYYVVAFFGVFYVIGFIIIGSAIIPLIKRGGYFIGTPDRLIQYRSGIIRSVDWEQFTGDIRISGNERKGTIWMKMRTGRMKRQKGGSIYIPDEIFITSVPGISDIEKSCRMRIKENAPVTDKSL